MALANDAMEFTLEPAEHGEFSVFCSVYWDPVRFRRDWTTPLTTVPPAAPCYWIMQAGRRVGGAVIDAGRIGPVFAAPPSKLAPETVEALLRFAAARTPPGGSIEARGVLDSQLEAFERCGFRRTQTRRCMMRPTESTSAAFPDGWIARPLAREDIDELAAMLHASFADGTGDAGPDPVEEYAAYLAEHFGQAERDEAMRGASAVAVDKRTGAIAGVCLIGRVEGWPFVAFAAVLPHCRGRGLASALIRRAIGALHGFTEPLLFVTVGNGAEAVYEKLGFRPAPAVTRLAWEPRS
ncbi:GNAT family N-acetyltransferase [Paenibacillus sp.]|uniref:GNAT family N-acetyltransferase n=1 Tax=Paenibacillus sp. TaxID=58172 RepID=UPI002D6A4304|nr:GNAT family N-acetyltransferase [Paenibacillus sp.]HZG86567.1 GNAT family N-acetyltransferase [Paenibacillus sp.]